MQCVLERTFQTYYFREMSFEFHSHRQTRHREHAQLLLQSNLTEQSPFVSTGPERVSEDSPLRYQLNTFHKDKDDHMGSVQCKSFVPTKTYIVKRGPGT